MREKLKLTEVQCKLALLVIFAFFYYLAVPYPEKSRQFPQLIALVSILFVVISLFFDFTKKETVAGEITDIDDTEVKVLDEATKKARKQRFYKAWAIIIVSALIGFLGGFLFSSLLLFLGFSLFFGAKKDLKKNAIVAAAMTALIYVVFELIMGVPLLTGILW